MRAAHSFGRAQVAAWLFLLVCLQPLFSVVQSGAWRGAEERYGKWRSPSGRLSSAVAPLDKGMPDAEVLPVWERFQQEALGPLNIFWQRRWGTPEAIYGPMADVSAEMDDPVRAARHFLARQAALFKLRSIDELQLIKVSESVGGIHVFFQQTYRGLPVHRSMMGIHINRAGQIHAVVNSYVPNVYLASTRPRWDSESAYDRMLAELAQRTQTVTLRAEPRRALVVYVVNGVAHLAWQITVPAWEPLGTWEAFWDAHTGQRLSPLVDRNEYVDGTGRVFITNAVVATGDNTLSDQNDSPSAVPDSAYSTVTLLDLDGSGFLNGPFVNTGPTSNRVNRADNDFTDLNRGDAGFEEVEAYWAIDDAQRYIQSLGVLSAANYSIGVDVHGLSADNSFYSGFGNGQGEITMGDGGVDDAEDGEIIWHEYGHAILDNQVPNIDQNFDGMGEGFGDYWAATLSTRHPSADHAQYDPAVGEWDATFYNPGNPPFLRRVDTSAHYPEDRSSDPHVTGMIWSAALWDIHQTIGRETADQIFLEGNFLLPPSPTLPEAAQAMLEADQNINGGANNQAMVDVFEARGLVTIEVQSPNGGENWIIGSDQTITWKSRGLGGNVNIELSRDNGTTFEMLFADTPNDGSETWTVTGPETNQALLRITSVDHPTVDDVSDSVFSISQPPPASITVTVPNGGEDWQIGSNQTIQWTSTGKTGLIQNVKIELSRDGGSTFEVLFSSTANDGSETWTVTGPATTQALIRITDTSDASVNDTSDASFTISEPPPPPPPGGCAATAAVAGTPQETDTLTLLYRFRDEVLARTPRGKRYIEQFYQFSPEAVSLLSFDPALLVQTQRKLERYKPVIQALVDVGEVKVRRSDLEQIDELLQAFAINASPSFRAVLDRLRRDLRDPDVQREFGVHVKP